nr:hypothetical protein [Lachnospiraceae bacterium]
YYGHAKAANLSNSGEAAEKAPVYEKDMYALVEKIMKYADKGVSKEKVAKKTGADVAFIEEVNRMYLTHRNVGVAGILDRIELKGMEKGV